MKEVFYRERGKKMIPLQDQLYILIQLREMARKISSLDMQVKYLVDYITDDNKSEKTIHDKN